MELGNRSIEVVPHLLVLVRELLADAIAEIALRQAIEALAEGVHHECNLPGGRGTLLLIALPGLIGDPLLLGGMRFSVLERHGVVLEHLQGSGHVTDLVDSITLGDRGIEQPIGKFGHRTGQAPQGIDGAIGEDQAGSEADEQTRDNDAADNRKGL